MIALMDQVHKKRIKITNMYSYVIKFAILLQTLNIHLHIYVHCMYPYISQLYLIYNLLSLWFADRIDLVGGIVNISRPGALYLIFTKKIFKIF